VSKFATCVDCGQLWDTEAPHDHDCPGSPDDRLDDLAEDLGTLRDRVVRLEEQLHEGECRGFTLVGMCDQPRGHEGPCNGRTPYPSITSPPPTKEPTFTLTQVLQMLTNVDTDVTCGGCVSLAMTGFGGYAHKEGCKNAPSEPVIMSLTSKAPGEPAQHTEWVLTDKARCPKRESRGIQCELPAGHEGLCACPEALDNWNKRRAI